MFHLVTAETRCNLMAEGLDLSYSKALCPLLVISCLEGKSILLDQTCPPGTEIKQLQNFSESCDLSCSPNYRMSWRVRVRSFGCAPWAAGGEKHQSQSKDEIKAAG